MAWQVRRPAGRCPGLLRRAAERAAEMERVRGGELSIAVVGARRMAALHLRHSGVPGATDVLTFDFGGLPRRLNGEIVVCLALAAKRASVCGTSEEKELALYVTHGVLHLLGYDDHTPRGYDLMHTREDEILASLGLGRVFARGRSSQASSGAEAKSGRIGLGAVSTRPADRQ